MLTDVFSYIYQEIISSFHHSSPITDTASETFFYLIVQFLLIIICVITTSYPGNNNYVAHGRQLQDQIGIWWQKANSSPVPQKKKLTVPSSLPVLVLPLKLLGETLFHPPPPAFKNRSCYIYPMTIRILERMPDFQERTDGDRTYVTFNKGKTQKEPFSYPKKKIP